MSLGIGALKVSGGRMQSRHSREVTMATLEAGTTQIIVTPSAWRTEGPADRVTWDLQAPKELQARRGSNMLNASKLRS